MGKLEVRDIYKAAHLFFRLSILPSLIEDKRNPGSYIFQFPDSEDVRREINNYIQNGELKAFVESYKYIRSLIYQQKRSEARS